MNRQNRLQAGGKSLPGKRIALVSVLGLGLASGAWVLRDSWAQDTNQWPSAATLPGTRFDGRNVASNANFPQGIPGMPQGIAKLPEVERKVAYVQEHVNRLNANGDLEGFAVQRPLLTKRPSIGAYFGEGYLLPKDNARDSRVRELASQLGRQLRSQPEDALPKAQLAELNKLLTEQFDKRHADQQQRVERLKSQTQEAEKILTQRMEQKDMIIARRMKELMGQRDPLNWDFSLAGADDRARVDFSFPEARSSGVWVPGPGRASGNPPGPATASLRPGGKPGNDGRGRVFGPSMPGYGVDSETPAAAPRFPPGPGNIAGIGQQAPRFPSPPSDPALLQEARSADPLRDDAQAKFDSQFQNLAVQGDAELRPLARDRRLAERSVRLGTSDVLAAAQQLAKATDEYQFSRELSEQRAVSIFEIRGLQIQLSSAIAELKLARLERETELKQLRRDLEGLLAESVFAEEKAYGNVKVSDETRLELEWDLRRIKSEVRMNEALLQAAESRNQIIDEMVATLGFESLDKLQQRAEALLQDDEPGEAESPTLGDDETSPASAAAATEAASSASAEADAARAGDRPDDSGSGNEG